MHQSTVLALVALSAMTMALPVSTIDGVPGGESDSPAVKRGTVETMDPSKVARGVAVSDSTDAKDGAFFGQYINYGVPPSKRDVDKAPEAQDAAFFGQYINYAVPPSKRGEELEARDPALHEQNVNYGVGQSKRSEAAEATDSAFHGQYVNYGIGIKRDEAVDA